MTTLSTLEELLTGPLTGPQGRVFVRDLVATAPQPIPPQVLDTPGAPEAAIVWALGEGEASRSVERREYAKSGFRSTSSVEWLRITSLELYGVAPREADFATTNVTVTNTSGALYGPFNPGELRFVNDTVDPPAVYANTALTSLPVGPSVTTVGVIALEAGSASTANIGEIDALESPLEGVTVTNAQPAIGQDAESAASLNGRIDARLGTFGVPGATGFSTGGSSSSFDSIARNGVDNGGGVPRADGSRITVTRTKRVLDILTGIYTLYVADDDGPLAGSDLLLVEGAVQAYAEWIGAQVEVENVATVLQSVAGAITIARASATDAEILAQIDDELLRATTEAPIGGFGGSLSVRYVENAVESAGDAGKTTAFTLVDIALTEPIAATPLAVNEVVILSSGVITIARVSG